MIELGTIRPWKPLLKLKPWTYALIVLAIVDSIFTVMVGSEHSFILLWVMTTFDFTLNQAMVMRIFYLVPLLYFLDKQTDFGKITFFLYIAIYFGLAGAQFLL